MSPTLNSLRAQNDQLALLMRQGRYPDALRLAQEVCAGLQRGETAIPADAGCAWHHLANARREMAQYNLAEAAMLEALKLQRAALGPEHPDYLHSLNDLARVYVELGQYSQAEPLHRKTLTLRQQRLGENHPDTLQSLHDLGFLLDLRGQRLEALQLIEQSRTLRQEHLGRDHPDLAESLITLAWLYSGRGRMPEAELLAREGLALRIKTVGTDHPDTGVAYHRLSGVFLSQGKAQDAGEAIEKALTIRQRLFGDAHPDTAASRENYALVLAMQGKTEEAETIARECLELTRTALGDEHLYVASSLLSLAYVLQMGSDYSEAETITRQAIDLIRRTVGDAHPAHAQALWQLADIYNTQEKFSEGEALLRQALSVLQRQTGLLSRETLPLLHSLTRNLLLVGNHEEARTIVEQALEISKPLAGEDPALHVGTLLSQAMVHQTSNDFEPAVEAYRQVVTLALAHPESCQHILTEALRNLASLELGLGHHEEAEQAHKELLEHCRKVLGPEHPDTTQSMLDLGNFYLTVHHFPRAEELFNEALRLTRQRVGDQHIEYARVLQELARLYLAMRNLEAAEVRYRQVLEIRSKAEGEDHPEFAQTLNDLAALYFEIGKLEAAEGMYRRALELRRMHLGEEHPEYAQSLHNLALLCQAMGNFEEAEPMLTQALEILREHAGEDDITYLRTLQSLALFHQAQGNIARAEELMHQGLDATRRAYGERHPSLVPTLSDLARLYGQMGNHLAARPLWEQVVEINKELLGTDSWTHANDLTALALVERSLGNLPRALELSQQAVTVLRDIHKDEHPEIPQALLLQAGLLRALERIPEAEQLYQQALDLQRSMLGKFHPAVATCLHELATFHASQMRFARAEALEKEALDVVRRTLGDNHPEYAAGLRTLATLHQAQGKFKDAETLLLQNLKVLRVALGDNHPFVVSSLQMLADHYRLQRQFDKAELHYQEALTTAKLTTPVDETLQATIQAQMGSCLLDLNRPAQAEPLLRRAIQGLRQSLGEDNPNTTGTQANLALLCASSGREAEALTLMEQLLIRDQKHLPSILTLQNDKPRAYCLRGLHEDFERYFALAIQQVDDSPAALSKLLTVVLRCKFLQVESLARPRQQVLEEKYPQWREELTQHFQLGRQIAQKTWSMPNTEKGGDSQEVLGQWRKQFEQSEQDLAEHLPEVRWQRQRRLIDTAQMARGLPPDSVLIEVVRYDRNSYRLQTTTTLTPLFHYVAFVLPAGQPEKVRLIDLGPGTTLEPLVTTWRQALGNTQSATNDEAGHALRSALFDPLHTALNGRTRLIFALDGSLVHIPVAALPAQDGGHLLDRFTISYIPTGRDLIAPHDPARHAPPRVLSSPAPVTTLPMPTPVPQSEGLFSRLLGGLRRLFTAIPQTTVAETPESPVLQQETGQIATLLHAELFQGKQVTRPCLVESFQSSILHLATPLQFPELNERVVRSIEPVSSEEVTIVPVPWRNPLETAGVLLAHEPEEHRLLTLRDVTALDLGYNHLLVLSLADPLVAANGWNVAALQRSFLIAGTHTLILSLWKIPDPQRAELLVEFYRRLQSGQGRVEALRDAQVTLKSRYPHPWLWAGLICHGHFGPLLLNE